MNDPIEIMIARIERLVDEWDAAQKEVPAGSHRCPGCGTVFDYSPICMSPTGDGFTGCADCTGWTESEEE